MGKEKTGIPRDKDFFDLERRRFYIPLRSVRGVQLAGEFWQTTKTDDYAADKEMVILVDASTGNKTITLPAAASSPGKVFYIKKTDTTGNRVTIRGNVSSETIDDGKTYEITVPYTCITVLCNGTEWWII